MNVPGLRITDVMSAPVVVTTPDATLEEVADVLLEAGVGSVVVVDRDDPGRPVGIVTETDFEVADKPIPFTFFKWPTLFGKIVWSESSLEEQYEAARKRTVESIMSSPVATVDENNELWEAVEVMVRNDIKRVPVLREGRLVGIVTARDLLKCLAGARRGPSYR